MLRFRHSYLATFSSPVFETSQSICISKASKLGGTWSVLDKKVNSPFSGTSQSICTLEPSAQPQIRHCLYFCTSKASKLRTCPATNPPNSRTASISSPFSSSFSFSQSRTATSAAISLASKFAGSGPPPGSKSRAARPCGRKKKKVNQDYYFLSARPCGRRQSQICSTPLVL